MTKAKPANEKSLWKDLLSRRVPQILGSYLIGGWAIIQFVDWNVKRYVLSPYLTDLALVIILSLIPTVVIVSYFHGKPGRNSWTRVEKFGIPLNIVATGLLLMVLFQNKELGAASKTIMVENEDGQRIERNILKAGLRKKVSLFNFKNSSGNTQADWLRGGLIYMLSYDLGQEHFISYVAPQDVIEEIRKNGSADGNNMPMRLKQKIAQESNQDFFLSGSILSAGKNYEVETVLYESSRAKEVSRRTYKNTDIFSLIDDMSLQLRKDLDIPEVHINEQQDLPIKEIFTASPEAAKALHVAIDLMAWKNDYTTAATYLEKAVEIDSLFTLAHLQLFITYANNNQTEKSRIPLEKTMKYLYKLPENSQFMVKSMYYKINEQPDKELAVLKMWSELYPDDVDVQYQIAAYHWTAGDKQAAIEAYRTILKQDPRDIRSLLSIGDLYSQANDPENSLSHYKQALEVAPDNVLALRKVGTAYELEGQYADAREYYNKALLLDEGNKRAVIDLGDILMKEGKLEEAQEKYEKVLSGSSEPQETSIAHGRLESLFAYQGKVHKALESAEAKWVDQRKFTRPLNMQFILLFDCHRYVLAGQPKKAYEILDNLEMFSPFDKSKPLGYARLYLLEERLDDARAALEDSREFLESSGMEWMTSINHVLEANFARLQGDYDRAIEKYELYRQSRLWDRSALHDLLGCYLETEQLAKLEEALVKDLKVRPKDPKINMLMAQLHLKRDEKQKAREFLDISADVWKDADPIFEPAQKLKTLMASLDNPS
ncbi:MAG: tetratricopeptide repeat protein [Calditrichia bacterium]